MNEKQLKANDNYSIANIFMYDGFSLKIPLNQRKYDWNMSEVEDYWEDLNKVLHMCIQNKNYSHYLGALSFIITDDKNNSDRLPGTIYEITDGQQRIITTSLLIASIRDVYLSMNNINNAKRVHRKYLICEDSSNHVYDKISVSKLDEYTYRNLVNVHEIYGNEFSLFDAEILLQKDGGRKIAPISGEYINKKIIDTYNYFFNQIVEKCSNLVKVEDKIELLVSIETALRRMQTIMITSRDANFLYMFFDTINNRGLQLNKMDIIRNKLLGIISNLNYDKVSAIGDLWDELVKILDNQDVSKFLKYYYICSQDKIISVNELPIEYESLFSRMGTYNNIKSEIEKMIDYANIYYNLFNGAEVTLTTTHEEKRILNINDIGQQACYLFLMDYFYYVKDVDRRNSMVVAIEKLMFRRAICRSSTKELDKIFHSMIKEKDITGNPKIYDDDKLWTIIKGHSPGDDEFSYRFRVKEWERNSLTNYVLRQLEYKEFDEKSELFNIIKSRKDVHIEHIAPDTPNAHWLNYLGLDTNKYKEYVRKLGNLVLLKSELNIKAKQKEFNVKKNEYYSQSQLNQVKEIMDYEEWSITAIENRTNTIYNKLKELWDLD